MLHARYSVQRSRREERQNHEINSTSQQSVLLFMPAQKAKLTDLGSMNGCFVNDTRIQGNSVPLNTGDLIKFGYDTATYR